MCIDRNGDGYGLHCDHGSDCRDNDAHVHPGAIELCNAIDDDCDGTIEEGFSVAEECTLGTATCERPGRTACLPGGTVVCCPSANDAYVERSGESTTTAMAKSTRTIPDGGRVVTRASLERAQQESCNVPMAGLSCVPIAEPVAETCSGETDDDGTTRRTRLRISPTPSQRAVRLAATRGAVGAAAFLASGGSSGPSAGVAHDQSPAHARPVWLRPDGEQTWLIDGKALRRAIGAQADADPIPTDRRSSMDESWGSSWTTWSPGAWRRSWASSPAAGSRR